MKSADYTKVHQDKRVDDADCTLDLPNGTTVHLTLDEVGNLWERMPEIYNEGRQRKMERQSSLVDPGSFGLSPVEDGNFQAGAISWSLPGAFGIWPAGIPLLVFSDNDKYRRDPLFGTTRGAKKNEPEEPPQWKLVFSRTLSVPLSYCAWDDIDGFKALVQTIQETPLETLMTQLMLQMPPHTREALMEDSDGLVDPAKRLLGLGMSAPPLDLIEIAKNASPKITLEYAVVFDPDRFRYVQLPSVIHAQAGNGVSLQELDRELANVGLVSLKGYSTQGWGDTQRLAVKKGHGRRSGKVASQTWQVLGVSQKAGGANKGATPSFSVGWLRQALTRNLGTVNNDVLEWDEWKKILKAEQ